MNTWLGLGWVGLDWVGLGWVGLDWVGLGWVGLGWVGLGWVGLGWVGLGWAGERMQYILPSTDSVDYICAYSKRHACVGLFLTRKSVHLFTSKTRS